MYDKLGILVSLSIAGVTKTYQHTFEHGDTLLRMALWWK